MGCISSKEVARSISVREKANPGSHGASVMWEDLLASHSGKDKLFSIVCSASGISNKLRSSSFSLAADPGTDQGDKFLARAWDLIPGVDAKTEVESGPDNVGAPGFGRFTRSRSCQVLRDEDELGIEENKIDWRDKSLAGSRSFHTVEEYDALLERIRRFGASRVEAFQDYESSDIDVSIQGTTGDCLKKESNEDANVAREGSSSSKDYRNIEKVVAADSTGETGWKRKSVAKGLKSLDVTSSDEFPGVVARFRQWYHVEAGGHIYSPGTYVTPKFGSYNAPAAKETEGGEDSVFSPELVAAFEDCVQQLQEEADSILSHMDEYSQVNDVMAKADSILSHMDEYSQVDDVMANRADKAYVEHE